MPRIGKENAPGAPAAHTHAEGDVTGLTTDLAGKAASSHTHPESDVADLAADLATKATAYAVRSKTGAYVLQAFDWVEADASGGPFNLTLPASPPTGTIVGVKKVDASANAVTIVGTIDGAVNPTMTKQWHSYEVIYDGTTWRNLRRPTAAGLVDWPATPDARYAQILGTRSVFIASRSGAIADGGTQAGAFGASPALIGDIALSDGATQGLYFPAVVPRDAKAAQPLSAAIYWAPGSTDAGVHAVRWTITAAALHGGDLVDTAGTTTTFTGKAQANTAKNLVVEDAQQILASVSALDLLRIEVQRIGADAADTYLGSIGVIGVRLDYTPVG